MPKTFYTVHDFQDLAKAGVTRIEFNDDIVITDEARERAPKLGMELVRADKPRPPAPPVASGAGAAPSTSQPDLHARVRTAVIAQLGGQVDPALLDRIITRVLAQVGR